MEGTARPDYSRCVQISTDSSLREMIPPGEAALISVGCVCVYTDRQGQARGDAAAAAGIFFVGTANHAGVCACMC